MDEDTAKITQDLLNQLASIEERFDSIINLATRKQEMVEMLASLETLRSRLIDIENKVSIFENINIDSDTLQELLALRPMLVEIRDQQLEIERVLPALKKG